MGIAATATADLTPRPDPVSAQVAARATGHRIEDLSQRSETEKVYANPDGTWTAETATAPERVKDDKGAWHDIDTTLVAEGGALRPRYAAVDVSLSDGGNDPFVSVTRNGHLIQWRWPGRLPQPVVSGNTATYQDVAPGEDLVITATPTGFTHSLILRQRPTRPVSLTLPVTVTGNGKLVKHGEGGLAVESSSGKLLVEAPQPLMWDASKDAGGDPGKISPVAVSTGKDNAGRPTMTLTPDSKFLSDPATTYPVTVDPSFTAWVSGDVWVENPNYTSGQVSSEELRVGTYDGGGHVARAFMHFNSTTWNGKDILSAKLVLRNYYSGSCTGAIIRASRITSSWDGNTLTWGNQPNGGSTYTADYTPAHGYNSTCDSADATWDIRDMVQDWASGNFTNNGIKLKAPDETSIYTWRRYRSANYSTSSVHPHINVTYNSYPGTASQPSLSPATTWTPPGGSSTYYASSTKPTMTSKATDPDGGTVRLYYEARSSASGSSTLLSSCTTAYVASGSNASCALGTALADNSTVSVRAKAYDGTDWAGKSQTATSGWSSWRTFSVAASNPPAPTISCTQGDKTWVDDPPADPVACSITAAGSGTNAPKSLAWTITGEPSAPNRTVTGTESFAQSTDPNVSKASFTVSNTNGGHRITATATSPSGRTSTSSYAFGYGKLALSSPSFDPVLTTANTVPVTASGPPALSGITPRARLRWRVASSGQDETTGWNDANATLKVTDNGAAGLDISGTWDSSQVSHDTSQNLDLDPRVPVMFDVQLCVDYDPNSNPPTTSCTWSVSKGRVLRVPHAFGAGFPVADAGPGQVAQWTGEFTTSDTDATVPGLSGDLSLSRAHSTFDGPATGAAGVFGPGWTAQLDGPNGGEASLQAYDDTLLDGTIAFVDPSSDDGSDVLVFAPTQHIQRRTTANLDANNGNPYDPVDDATALSGVKLVVAGTGTGTTLTTTDPDGTVTTFDVNQAPATGVAATFVPTSVQEAGQPGKTTYTYNGGKVTRILAPLPPGVTSCPALTISDDVALPAGFPDGCRDLRIVYATTTTATSGTPGDIAGQVKSLWYDNGGTSTKITEYSYDASKRLVSVLDKTTGLATSYGYDGASNRLATVTEPGLAPWTINYDTSAGSAKVSTVTRTLNGAETRVATFLYDVPMATSGLPDLSPDAVTAWGQAAENAPTHAYAAFGQDAGNAPTDPAQVTDWKRASLAYTDDRGYTRNTAEYGAGRWLLTATDYDDHDNVTRQLDTGDIARIQDGDTTVNNAGTYFRYDQVTHPDATGADAVTIPAGTVMTDAYGPAHTLVLPDGTTTIARTHTHTNYDEGAPNYGISPAGTGYGYPTTQTVTSATPDMSADIDNSLVSKTKTGYDVEVPGTTSGWDLGGAATKTTTIMASGQSDITNVTGYDSVGRVVENRQPASNGSDAGTRQAIYYTADGSSADDQCDNHPAWAGELCVIRYKDDPATGPKMLVTRTEGYNTFLSPTKVTESTDGTVRRTTETTYDAAGRISKTWTYAAASMNSPAAPGAQYAYDPNTGLVTSQQALDGQGNIDTGTGEITTAYDSWGRPIDYTPAAGETTTTHYDDAGRIDKVTDPQGITTYTYDGGTGTDANGNLERRGLPTTVKIDNTAGGSATFSGAYNADGTLGVQELPGQLTQRTETDEAGNQIGLTYSGQVTADDGTVTQDQPWLGWSEDDDTLGRTIREMTPGAAGYDGALTGTNASGYARIYGYDRAGRLTHVEDYTAPAGAGGFDDNATGTASSAGTDMPTGTVCQVRDYTFDANGNRTKLARTAANPDGSCGTVGGTGTTTKTWSYDSADRLTGNYVYDELGRATTIPVGDSPSGLAGTTGATDLVLGYFADDSARTLTQNGQTTTFTLDAGGRRSTSTTAPSGGGTATERIERHYTDDSDNPGWAVTTTGTGTSEETSTTRYAESLSGDLAATVTTGAALGSPVVSLPLVNLHGDTISTVTVPSNGAPSTGLDSWVTSDEYGNPLTPTAEPGDNTVTGGTNPATGVRYGWLGGKQRATDSTGLVLMGARLYDPVTGSFTSPDPVVGGNSTTYTYPQDPKNERDPSGKCSICDLIDGGIHVPLPAVYGWKWVRRTPHEIGRIAENRVIQGLMLFYGLRRDQIHRGPSGRNRLRTRAGELRIMDISAPVYGVMTYYEVKGNGSRYTARQRRLDKVLRSEGYRIRFIRITGISLYKRVYTCLKRCPPAV